MKKGFVSILIVNLFFSAWADSVKPVASVSEGVRTCTFTHDHVSDFRMDGLSLYADSGKVLSSFMLSAQRLPSLSAPLAGDMTNVTDGVDGFRLLPSGEHFSEPATIAIAYNPARLPIGYSPEDIYTFCYDSAVGHWTRLHRTRVDTLNKMVYSLTTHFTDFANFVIRVPEMPETKAFVPTDMQDLPDPDPLTGVPMIAAPRANNMGTAELTYPITLPPGRHGLQPDLDLHYSSAGGNGLLGVGWSFSQPAITIDTRWGVPRYDLRYETEAYLVNGEPVLLHDADGSPIPLPHQQAGFRPRSIRATRFYPRDQRNQSKVVRHGRTPNHYWWTVQTTDGVTYYYGYDPIDGHLDENSILRTSNGNIGYWALTCVMDQYENYVYYYNSKDGYNELLIDSIAYTGNVQNGLPPYYWVRFYYRSRPDSSSDARLGLLRYQSHRICQIHIGTSSDEQLATYRMTYAYGVNTLYKSRLTSVAKIDADIDYLVECEVPVSSTYMNNSHEQWIIDEDDDFAGITHENAPHDTIPASMTRFTYADAYGPGDLFTNAQSLLPNIPNFSASRSEGWNLGGAVTVGLGYNPAMTVISAGANYSYNQNVGGVKTMMIDLNGDGLTDHLSVSGRTVWYRRQKPNHTFYPPIALSGLSELSREVSLSNTFGVQLDFVANLSYNPTYSSSYTDIYFADVNGDGLPDLISPDGIHINTLVDSIPVFSQVSDAQTGLPIHGNTCDKVITFDGEVDDNLMCTPDYRLREYFRLSDLLPEDDGEEEFVDEEMVPDAPLEGNGGSKNTDSSIAKDMLVLTRGDVKRPPENWEEILQGMFPGDDYYFELQGEFVFVYQKEYRCDTVNTEPNVDIVRVWVADSTGVFGLRSIARLLEDTSEIRAQARMADGVRLRIQWNRSVHPLNNRLHADSVRMLYDKFILADNYTTDSTQFAVSARKGDIFFFRLSARNNRRFDDVNWEQTIFTAAGDTLYNSAHDYLCTGDQNFVAPQSGWVRVSISCTNADTIPVLVRAMLQTDTLMAFTMPASSQKDTALLWRSVQEAEHISFHVDTLSQEPLWYKVRIIPSVDFAGVFEVDSQHHTMADTLHYHPDVHLRFSSHYPLTTPIEGCDTCYHRRLFGPMHKGWGWFAYNDVRHHTQIALDSLQNEEIVAALYANTHQSTLATYTPVIDSTAADSVQKAQANAHFAATHTYNPLADDKYWVPIHVDYAANVWKAYGNTGSLGQYLHSTAKPITLVADTTIIKEEFVEYDSPIPTKHGGLQRVTTIRKSTYSQQEGLSYGVSVYGFGVSNTFSWGSYDVTSDYMDMNGDGYPDFVGYRSVQYSNPWGGIGELRPSLPQSFYSTNSSAGLGFSASRPLGKHAPNNGVKDSKMFMGGIGGGLSGQTGYDGTHTSFMDMNADGLPDIVDAVNHRVRYNLGYSFTPNWYSLPSVAVASSSHTDASISLSGNAMFEQISDVINLANGIKDYSSAQYSISGGFSHSVSENKSNIRLMDINGDGYPDLLIPTSNNTVYVQLYNGSSFGSLQALNIQEIQHSNTGSIGFNLAVTAGFDLVLFPIKFCFGVHTTPWNVSSTASSSDFMDIDGDGYPDQVLATPNGIYVRYNKNGSRPVNLLTSVVNPTGQRIGITYTLSEPSDKHRTRTWNMTAVNDLIPNSIDDTHQHNYTFSYSNPFYDNFEKTDYGYEQVNTNDQNTKFLQETYENQHYINKNEKTSDLLFDAYHHPLIGHAHEIRYHDSLDVEHSDVCNDIYLHVGTEGYWTDYYEGMPTPQITTRYEKFYDKKHNLIRYIDHGDVTFHDDDWEKNIIYKQNYTHNMLSLPRAEYISDFGGPYRRVRYACYNKKGKPFQIAELDTAFNNNRLAVTELEYDQFGNISYLRGPANEMGQHAWRTFTYDHYLKTHVTEITNQFNEQHLFDYDLRYGLWIQSQDPAGNKIDRRFDRMGRLIDVVAPDMPVGSYPYSVHYTYRLPYHNLTQHPPLLYPYPHVTKVAADTGLVSADVTLYDARGQAIQKKSFRTVAGHEEWVTDGLRYKDVWYRTTSSYDPFITDTYLTPLWEPDHHPYHVYETLYGYDNLDRLVKTTHPDLTELHLNYYFDLDKTGKKRLETMQMDENGNKSHVLYAPQGWMVETNIWGDASITQYAYNPIGELTQVIDADTFVTRNAYDMFGNRVWRQHPDAGETWWRFAPNGNLTSLRTARLNIIPDSIRYVYSYNRLTDIWYPFSIFNNVHYTYDAAGRLASYSDGTGSTQLTYDALGNVSNTTRRIVLPKNANAYTFRTETKYDNFGRIRYVVYPDGDSAIYHYYLTGELREVRRHAQDGPAMPVVTNLTYDPMGHNIYRLYGNGAWTDYTYEPYRNRLSNLQTKTPLAGTLQTIDYSYDGVGNITRMDQTASSIGSLGGPYRNDYTYDYQYRLTEAECSSGDFQYRQRNEYSLAGRLGHSFCSNTSVVDIDAIYGYDNHRWTHQPRVVYDSETSTRMSLCWDANGNLFHVQDCAGKRGRFHDWDEENRLRMVIGSKSAGYYGYDANGERVYKLTGESSIDFLGQGIADATVQFDDAVLYPNPYLTVTSQGYTKHYYANGERLASVIGHGGWHAMSSDPIDLPSSEEKDKQELIKTQYDYVYPLDHKDIYSITDHNEDIEGMEQDRIQYDCDCNQLRWISVAWEPDLLYLTMDANTHPNGYPEDEIYYTHSDHLGSSAWITDQDAKPVQYLHYLPYGQLLANQSPSGYDERFKFIGKERDWESGYDYFGARYLCSPFKHWLSPDPLSDKDPGISSYAYCRWNPVKYVDPKGEEWLTEEDVKQATHYIQAMENRISDLQAQQSKVMKASRREYIQNEIDIMQKGIEELHEMGATTEQKFTYSTVKKETDGATYKLFGVIVMGVPEGNDALGIHESSHGYDLWKGELLPSMKSEIKAYQRQFVFNEALMPISRNWPERISTLGQIRPSWIRGILNSKGEYPYLRLK